MQIMESRGKAVPAVFDLPPLSSAVTVCLLHLSMTLLFGLSAVQAAAHLTGAYVALVAAYALGSGEAHGRSPTALAMYTAAALTQLLPSIVPASIGIAVCVAVCVITYLLLVRVCPPPLPSLEGRICVVTGSSAGLGAEMAAWLLELGATVIFACRSEARARTACAAACSSSGAPASRAVFVPLDLSSCESITACATLITREFGRCDAVVLNAGGFAPARSLTAEGWESNLGCHAIGHHLLTLQLLPLLRAAPHGGRVVSVASVLHKTADAVAMVADPMCERGYAMFAAYARSKLAQVVLSAELQRHPALVSDSVACVSLHPGNCITEVTRNFALPVRLGYTAFTPLVRLATPSIRSGAATAVAAVAVADDALLRGAYLERCAPAATHDAAADPVVARALWKLSVQLLSPWVDPPMREALRSSC